MTATYTRAFSTLGCPTETLDEAFALAVEFGVPAVELRMLEGTTLLPELWKACGVSPEQLAATVRAAGKTVPVLDTSLRLIGNTEAERAELIEFVPFAEALGVRYLRVFDGGSGWNEASLNAAQETIAWWRDWRRARGCAVDLIVETHDTLLTTSALREFREAFPERPLLWDAHHTWAKGGESLSATWAVIAPAVRHVHVKDSVVGEDRRRKLVLPGRGDFPMEELRRLLAAAQWRGAVSLEWEKGWVPDLPALRDALWAARACSWW